MRIGMVLDHVFPPDIRVEKEARALTAAGHRVYLLALARHPQSGTRDIAVPGIEIRRIPRQPLPQRLLHAARLQFTFRSRYWGRAVRKFAADYELDALHVHDLPMAGTVLDVARALGVPCVIDLHENYPALMQIWHEGSHGLTRWLTGRYERWRAYEASVLPQADAVIVVADESRLRITEAIGVAPERTFVVMNAEDAARFSEATQEVELPPSLKERFIISYIGGSGRHRGLDIAISAMAHLGESCPSAALLIVGIRGAARDAATAQIRLHGLARRVHLVGWVDANQVRSYIEASDVCLVPHRKNPQTESGAPHKLFQYMLMGKPVIVSDCAPLKRIVEDAGAGLVFRAGNPQDLAEKIKQLYDTPELCASYGERGREAATGKYAWRHQADTLLQLYASLQTGR